MHLRAGERRTVTFTVVPEDHSVLRDAADLASVVEAGPRAVWVGASSDPSRSPGLASAFTVAGAKGELR